MEFKSYKIKDIGDVVTGFTPSKKKRTYMGLHFHLLHQVIYQILNM